MFGENDPIVQEAPPRSLAEEYPEGHAPSLREMGGDEEYAIARARNLFVDPRTERRGIGVGEAPEVNFGNDDEVLVPTEQRAHLLRETLQWDDVDKAAFMDTMHAQRAGREQIEGARWPSVTKARLEIFYHTPMSLVARATGDQEWADSMNRQADARSQAYAELKEEQEAAGSPIAASVATGFSSAAESIGKAVPAGMLAGPSAAVALFAWDEYNTSLTKGKDQGKEGKELVAYAGAQALAEGLPAAAFNKIGLGGMETASARALVGRTFKEAFKKAVVQLGLGELPEETLTEFMHLAIDRTSNIDPNALSAKSLSDSFKQIFITTGITMGLAESPTVGGAKVGEVRDSLKARKTEAWNKWADAKLAEQERVRNLPETTKRDFLARQEAIDRGAQQRPDERMAQEEIARQMQTSREGTPEPGAIEALREENRQRAAFDQGQRIDREVEAKDQQGMGGAREQYESQYQWAEDAAETEAAKYREVQEELPTRPKLRMGQKGPQADVRANSDVASFGSPTALAKGFHLGIEPDSAWHQHVRQLRDQGKSFQDIFEDAEKAAFMQEARSGQVARIEEIRAGLGPKPADWHEMPKGTSAPDSPGVEIVRTPEGDFWRMKSGTPTERRATNVATTGISPTAGPSSDAGQVSTAGATAPAADATVPSVRAAVDTRVDAGRPTEDRPVEGRGRTGRPTAGRTTGTTPGRPTADVKPKRRMDQKTDRGYTEGQQVLVKMQDGHEELATISMAPGASPNQVSVNVTNPDGSTFETGFPSQDVRVAEGQTPAKAVDRTKSPKVMPVPEAVAKSLQKQGWERPEVDRVTKRKDEAGGPGERESLRMTIGEVESRIKHLREQVAKAEQERDSFRKNATRKRATVQERIDATRKRINEMEHGMAPQVRQIEYQNIEDRLDKSIDEAAHLGLLYRKNAIDMKERPNDQTLSGVQDKLYNQIEAMVDEELANSAGLDKEELDRAKGEILDQYLSYSPHTNLSGVVKEATDKAIANRKEQHEYLLRNMKEATPEEKQAVSDKLDIARDRIDWWEKTQAIMAEVKATELEREEFARVKKEATDKKEAKEAKVKAKMSRVETSRTQRERRKKDVVEERMWKKIRQEAKDFKGPKKRPTITRKRKVLADPSKQEKGKAQVYDTIEEEVTAEILPHGVWAITEHPGYPTMSKAEQRDVTRFTLTHIQSGENAGSANTARDLREFAYMMHKLMPEMNDEAGKPFDSKFAAVARRVDQVMDRGDLSVFGEQYEDLKQQMLKMGEGIPTQTKADIIIDSADMLDRNQGQHSNRAKAIIKKLVAEVPEFAYDPVMRVEENDEGDKRLVFRDSYKFSLAPEVFGFEQEEVNVGQTVGFHLEDMGHDVKTEADVVSAQLKSVGHKVGKTKRGFRVDGGTSGKVDVHGDGRTWTADAVGDNNATFQLGKQIQDRIDAIRWTQKPPTAAEKRTEEEVEVETPSDIVEPSMDAPKPKKRIGGKGNAMVALVEHSGTPKRLGFAPGMGGALRDQAKDIVSPAKTATVTGDEGEEKKKKIGQKQEPGEDGEGKGFSEGMGAGLRKQASDTIAQVIADSLAITSPAHVTPFTRKFGHIARKRMAEAEQRKEVAVAELGKMEKVFYKMPKEEGHKFIDRFENGEKQPTKELQEIADIMELVHARALKDMQDVGTLKDFIEHYFPHIWQQRKGRDTVAGRVIDVVLRKQGGMLKKRKYLLFKEGLEAGLKPITDNPVAMMLLRVGHMHEYAAMTRMRNDVKKSGWAKFVPATFEATYMPSGYEIPDDPMFHVQTKAGMDVREAYDAMLMEQLEGVARQMGVTHDRLAVLKGGKGDTWGLSYPGMKYIKSKFAGPLSVIAHEIGHQIGDIYGLWDYMHTGEHVQGDKFAGGKKAGQTNKASGQRKRAQLAKEWRALADLRMEGLEDVADDGFKKYIREKPEKEAVILEAWLAAPEKMAKVAPMITEAWKEFLGKHDALKPLLALDRSVVLDTRNQYIAQQGIRTLGSWAVPKDVNRMIANMKSRGFRNSKNGTVRAIYQTMRQVANVMVQMSHSLSGFHAINVGFDTTSTQTGIAMQKFLDGDLQGALKGLRAAPASAVTKALKGSKLRQAMRKSLDALEENDPIRKEIEMVIRGGGSASMDLMWRNNAVNRLHKTMQDLKYGTTGEKIAAGIRAPAMAVMSATEIMAIPLMEKYIPTLKLGSVSVMNNHTMDEAAQINDDARKKGKADGLSGDKLDQYVEENGWNQDRISEELSQNWDSIDNRLGQLAYRNLFWSTMLKDISMILLRSPGWNLGFLREFGGAAIDLVKTPSRMAAGEKVLTRRMGYAGSALSLYAVSGMILQYLLTGEPPRELKDAYFPRTGHMNPDGTAERLNLPFYSKDIAGYMIQPIKTVQHKAHPMIGTMSDLATNEDFYGTEIWSKNDPTMVKVKDAVLHAMESFVPFSVKNAEKIREAGAPAVEAYAVGFTGIGSAPAYVSRTEAQALMSSLMKGRGGRKRNKAEAAIAKRRKLNVRKLRRGETLDAKDKEGFTARQVKRIRQEAKKTPFQVTFDRLSLEEALDVYMVANTQERSDVYRMVIRKRRRTKKIEPDLRQYYEEWRKLPKPPSRTITKKPK